MEERIRDSESSVIVTNDILIQAIERQDGFWEILWGGSGEKEKGLQVCGLQPMEE